MKSLSQSQQISAGITFIICLFLLLSLLIIKMAWNPAVDTPEPDPYITMAVEEEEFIEVEVLKPQTVGDEDVAPALTPEDMNNEAQPAPQSGTDLTTQGKTESPVQPVTQNKPSPATEKPRQTTSKPAAAIDNKKEQEEKALAQRTQNTVNNAFANANNKHNATNGSKDEGFAGKASGNPDSGAGPKANGTKAGSATGHAGGGWRIPAYSRNIPSNELGSVVFEVVINADGSVGKITQISNNGLTSATIAKCRAEIQRHKFTHPNIAEAEPATARITFNFQDPK